MALRRHQMPHPTGWVKAPPDPRTLRLARYTTPTLPATPYAANYLKAVAGWPMLANDRIGDCAPCAIAHHEQAWTVAAGADPPYLPTDADTITAYTGIAGYDPARVDTDGNNPTDTGCTSLDTLNYWRRSGIAGRRIVAYAQVNHANHHEIRAAVNLFGGVFAAVELPLAAGQQFRKRQTWRPTAGPAGERGSWGGHAVYLGAYNGRGLTCVTWGTTQRLTWSWWDTYGAECYAAVSGDFLNRGSDSNPAGINLDQMLADLHQLTGQ